MVFSVPFNGDIELLDSLDREVKVEPSGTNLVFVAAPYLMTMAQILPVQDENIVVMEMLKILKTEKKQIFLA